ncbi:hypothetical protein F5146DRAFT_1005541 [Armillaria mellea]|nr:hypothetical protein F5146DRAFT_1005541 [Armillaria mellea]
MLGMPWMQVFHGKRDSEDLQHKPRGRVINTRRQRTLYPGLVHLEACQTIHLARFEVKKTRGDELIAVDGESTAMPSDKPVLSALGVELDDFRLLLNRLLVPVKLPCQIQLESRKNEMRLAYSDGAYPAQDKGLSSHWASTIIQGKQPTSLWMLNKDPRRKSKKYGGDSKKNKDVRVKAGKFGRHPYW